jgi:hypothetical protein
MGVTDGASRKASVDQFAVERLDVERGDRDQRLRAQTGPHVAPQQPVIVLKALRPQTRSGADLQPAVQILIQRLLRRAQIPAAIPLAKRLVELTLRIPQFRRGWSDSDIFASWFRDRGRCARVPATCGGFTGHEYTSSKSRHTKGTKCRARNLKWWELMMRTLTDSQSASDRTPAAPAPALPDTDVRFGTLRW